MYVLNDTVWSANVNVMGVIVHDKASVTGLGWNVARNTTAIVLQQYIR